MKKLSRRSFGKASLGLGTSLLMGSTELRFVRRASAVVARPTIAGTSAWGASAPLEAVTVLAQKPVGIVVHHTENQNTNIFTQSAAYSRARQIQQSHFSRGWIDTGQQLTISRGGYIMEGRHRSVEVLDGGAKHVVGAHVTGYNNEYIGIECEGVYNTVTPTLFLYNNLVATIAYICQQYGLTPSSIVGHRDLDPSGGRVCPGDTLHSMLPQLRNDVAKKLAGTTAGRTWPIVRRSSPAQSLVKSIQYLLNATGAGLVADGIFGAGTETAVKNFQTSRAISPADGVVGAATWEKLIQTVRLNDKGDAVKALQTQLVAQGYSVTVDGAFGSTTDSQVKSFQTNRKLTVDGIVGINTWNHLTM